MTGVDVVVWDMGGIFRRYVTEVLVDEHASGLGVVRGPGIPHSSGRVKQIAGMHCRRGKIVADRREDRLVPVARHRQLCISGALALRRPVL